MRFPRKRGATSVKARVFIPDNSVTTGAGCAGLTNASTNLAVCYSRENDNGGTEVTGANLLDITTIGTWADPGAGKVRIKAVDATKLPGLYEIHFPDAAAFGTGDTSQNLIVNVYEKTTTALKIGPNMVMIPLSARNVLDGESDFVAILGSALSGTAAQIAAAFVKFFDKASPTGTVNGIPDAVAGATGGLAIVGSVMGKSPATLAVGDVTGNLPVDLKAITVGVGLSAQMKADVTAAVPTAAGVRTEMDANSTKLTAIDGKTTNLPTDPADQSLIIDATNAIMSRIGASGSGLTAITGVTLAASQPGVTIPTVTNLTNAPTNGDLTATMKTSVQTAATAATPTAAAVTGSVGSVASYGTLVADVAAAVWASVVEGTITAVKAMRGILAASVGKLSGAATTTITIRDASDTKARITATVTADGDRSAVTTDLT